MKIAKQWYPIRFSSVGACTVHQYQVLTEQLASTMVWLGIWAEDERHSSVRSSTRSKNGVPCEFKRKDLKPCLEVD